MPQLAPRSLLDEIEARQDEVLRQLDELNGRIERLLAEYAPATGVEVAGPVGTAASQDGQISRAA
jgi:hypothetical protein